MTGWLSRSGVALGLRQMRSLAVKELQSLFRDRPLFVFIVYIFTLHIVVSTLGATMDLRHSPTLVDDADRSPISRELTHAFREPYFSLMAKAASSNGGLGAIDDGTARVVVHIPEQFERTIRRGAQPAHVQVLVDSSQVALGFLAASYSTRLVHMLGSEIATRSLAERGVDVRSLPAIQSRERTLYNFSLNDHWPVSLSVLITMMTVACVMLAAAAAVREKERGTIEQLLVSPVTPVQLMLSKTFSMVFVTVVGTAVALWAIMGPIFGVPMRGSATLFLATVAVFAFTNAGLGLALATLAKNSGQAGLLVILVVLPMIQLSGTYSPAESMPPVLRAAMNVSPLHHFVRIAYGITFRGETFVALWRPVASMSALGAAVFALGLWRFRRQFS